MCLGIAIERPQDVLSRFTHLGFECVTVNNGSGFRCGYVRIPMGHPWHGKTWNDDSGWNPSVHGGITFNEPDEPCGKGEADDAWWIGFDCAHSGDLPDPELRREQQSNEEQYAIRLLQPLMETFFDVESPGDSAIRTQEYVEAECRRLCEQAKEAQIK